VIRESWLAELSPDAPCGPDLSYDQDFLALEAEARGKEEQQYGDTIIPAEEPVWPDVVERASALLDRSRDLRLVHLLARGLTRTQGLAGTAAALNFARELLGKYWEPVHPQLVIDGEPDPVVRMNALGDLAAPDGLLRDIRAAHFLRTPAVALTVRDVENILDKQAGVSEGGVGLDQFRATVGDLIAADAAALGEAGAVRDAVNAIRSALLEHFPESELPDFAPLFALVDPIARFVAEARAPAEGQSAGTEGSAVEGASGPAVPGTIRSRDDAIRALERVCEFLARTEPSNPAPLLIRRAQRLMTMSFLDIIRDLAPEATAQVETITGAKNEG
jgi:type VI secretion system protein ImpA